MLLPSFSLPLLSLVSGGYAATCSVNQFKKTPPSAFGVEVLDIFAEEVKGWVRHPSQLPTMPALPVEERPVDFCNITVQYTHPGLNDTVRVSIWLPLEAKDWNHRFLGQGGGGYSAGLEGSLGAPVALGYAASVTDSGHSMISPTDSTEWALTSPGNVNLHLLQNFGYRSLDEMATIGKAITQHYYGDKIKYSYWNGCSTGGRQGLVMAQRYPTQYQGIISACPAINWVTFLVTEYYSHVVMKSLGYYPPACELNAISALAVEACDELDGVKDGIVSAPGLCKFDVTSAVGKAFDCAGEKRKISKDAAQIAQATWTGPSKDGEPIWFGLTHETALGGYEAVLGGLAATSCDEKNKKCKSSPFPISADWIRNFVLKEPTFDLDSIDEDLFHDILRISRQQYHSLMDSADPDLNPFKKAGGKLITWHGLTDQLIAPNGTTNYWERVAAVVPGVDDFFRHFEVPGIAHCYGGPGAFPFTTLNALVDWVENGKAPDRLDGQSLPVPGADPATYAPSTRPLCPYPKVAAYKGGDISKASSFACEDGFGNVKAKHDEL